MGLGRRGDPVPLGMAAVSTAMRGSALISSLKPLPNTDV